ncbi:MAG: hypothetical protein H6839_01820 [Planctomycetes bacterium]|nr:hypothetical protein [Planctomycetota bacterium]
MFDPFTLPAEEQAELRRELQELYASRGGDDIDRAIARDRKVLSEHERELDHVATLPFDKPYRWRIAPSVGLRAQKDLERQSKARSELIHECMEDLLRKRGHVAAPKAPAEVTHGGPLSDQVERLNALLARAVAAVHNYEQREERMEASPPVEPALV